MRKAKSRIIVMLTYGKMTLTQICRETELSSSTVHQHLQELQQMGAIYPVVDPYIKKWKYYEIEPDFDFGQFGLKQELVAGAISRQRSVRMNVDNF